METTVNATEAKTHFSKLMKRAAEAGETIIVERSGSPQIVIMGIDEFNRLKSERKHGFKDVSIQRIRCLKRTIHERLTKEGKDLPDIADLINELREERDAETRDGLR